MNQRTGLLLRGGITNSGYQHYSLTPDSGYTDAYTHRLVADAFLDASPEEDSQINHIDGYKLNNHWTNLEWVSRSENMNHAYHLGLKRPADGYGKVRVRIIETGEVFESQLACARALGGFSSGISNVLYGKSRSYLGYTYERVLN